MSGRGSARHVKRGTDDLPGSYLRSDRRERWSTHRGGRPEAKGGDQRNGGLWRAEAAVQFDQGWSEDFDHAPAPVFGAYPNGFLYWASRAMGVRRRRLLHVCSGTLERGEGVRVDVREDARPDVRADGRQLPFLAGSFDGVMLDPPYTEKYSRDLYGTEWPRARPLLAEAARVVRPQGAVGILHFFVPNPPPGCAIERVYGVTVGCGFRVRAFVVYRKEQAGLGLVPAGRVG